jgi:hypothetical protein
VFLTDRFSAIPLNPEVENRPLLKILHSLHSGFPVLDRLGSYLPCTLHHHFYTSHQISRVCPNLGDESNFARCEIVQPPLLLKHRISEKAYEFDTDLRSDALSPPFTRIEFACNSQPVFFAEPPAAIYNADGEDTTLLRAQIHFHSWQDPTQQFNQHLFRVYSMHYTT